MSLFERWDKARLNQTIKSEDRTFGKNWLYVDLIPASCCYTNVGSNIDEVDWERIKEMCKKRANYRPGVQQHSGSTSFNPGTQYNPNQNSSGINPNKSPYEN